MPSAPASAGYRTYVLIALMLVYLFNFLDRQILAILAQDIKHDLRINDASMGFLLGTSFAVFYAIFGIPLGKAADVLPRTRLISVGLSAWSSLTTLSGLARSFDVLALLRMGVGIGEASASPAVYSLICDYFPPRYRTTALAIYSSGIFIGAGLGLAVGGLILTGWKAAYPDPATAPFGLKGWNVAFMAVGLPGFALAVLIATIREPVRGGADGVAVPRHPARVQAVVSDLLSTLPGTGLVLLIYRGGARLGVLNLGVALSCLVLTWALGRLTGDALQWAVLCGGAYCFATWAQHLARDDRPAFASIFCCRTLIYGSLGFAGCFFLTAAALAWLAIFFQRVHHTRPAEVGLLLGLSYAVFGFLGVTCGGVLADRLVVSHGAAGRLILSALALAAATACMAGVLVVDDKWVAFALTAPFNFFSAMYVAPGAANVNGLVPPAMRARASAAYIVCVVLLGSALGPFVVGVLSDMFAAYGETGSASARLAIGVSLLATLPATLFLLLAARHARDQQAATGAGLEPV